MTDEEKSVSIDEEVDPLKLFPEEWRTPVEGLLYLGKLTETVEFCGHRFGLKTLLPHEKFAVGVALQPYRNTIMEVDAFQTAHVAMALTSVDSDEDFCPPIGPDINSFAGARLRWLSKRFYSPTIDFLWTKYKLLDVTADQGTAELDRLLKGGLATTLPSWLDSWIGRDTSPDETASDTPQPTPSSNDS